MRTDGHDDTTATGILLSIRSAALRDAGTAPVFEARLDRHLFHLVELLLELYGPTRQLAAAAARLGATLGSAHATRPDDLRALDDESEDAEPWYQSNQELGAWCYVDRWAGNLAGLRERIGYLRELGVTYLHLMPPFAVPEGNNDGGYAVSSFRELAPHLGTMAELADLARELRGAGIRLVLDFVLNHTASNHPWARAAEAGDPFYRDFYWIYPDRTMPDAFEEHAREIFPDDHPGVFTPVAPGDPRWVWTTFHDFQWDLNWTNPEVLVAMIGELLFLANQGTQVLRMDAVAFLWKELGTVCESLPQAHTIVQVLNAACRIAAPSVIFKSEAIVHPDEVVEYVRLDECQISYNPLQMALGWEALATRRGELLHNALEHRHGLPDGTAWVNYVRSHDDIGWTFADEDAAALGIDGYHHRRFLNAFYTGKFPGTFAEGVAFQENPRTGDARVCGTTAALCGVGKEGVPQADAVERILLEYSLALSTGGLPLLNLGDEVAQPNDWSWQDDPALAGDSRWAHRPYMSDELLAQRHDPATPAGQVFAGLMRMLQVRREAPEFNGVELIDFYTPSPHVVAYQRPAVGTIVLCLANFADHPELIDAPTLGGFGQQAQSLLDDEALDLREGVELPPRTARWIRVYPTAGG